MSLSNWKTTRSKSIRVGRNNMQRDYDSHSKWVTFWRGITKLKNPSSDSFPFAIQKTYDHQSYVKNFDEGFGRNKPDNLYRSFSPDTLILQADDQGGWMRLEEAFVCKNLEFGVWRSSLVEFMYKELFQNPLAAYIVRHTCVDPTGRELGQSLTFQ